MPGRFDDRARPLGFGRVANSVPRSASPRGAQELARFHALVDLSGDGFFLVEAPEGRIAAVNLAACQALSIPRELLTGRSFPDLAVPESRTELAARLAEAANGDPPPAFGCVLAAGDGGHVRTEMTVSRTAMGGRSYLMVVTSGQAREEAGVSAQGASAMELAAMELLKDGLAVSEADGGFSYVNAALAAMYGYEQDALGDGWRRLLPPDERERFERRVLPEVMNIGAWKGEALGVRSDGGLVHAELSITRLDGNGRALWVARDVTDRKLAEARLARQAWFDDLTGLPNRALFLDRLGVAMRRLSRHPEQGYAVLFLDVDRFKQVNDAFGHAVGDQLLREIANRLARCARQEDTVCRFGGDEFAVLLADCRTAEAAAPMVERILEALSAPASLDRPGSGRVEVRPAASVGVTLGDPAYETSDEVMRDADAAMYRAKQAGSGRWALFSAPMRRQPWGASRLDAELRRAIHLREIFQVFQPIVDLPTGKIAGFETLTRWRKPSGAMAPPSTFIPLAEESELIDALGGLALRSACRLLARLRGAAPGMNGRLRPDLFVSVNLSPRQLDGAGLANLVGRALDAAGAPAGGLKLEIPERALLENADVRRRALHALRDLGARCAIDDFGTGRSPLVFLSRFPVDELKIDRSFVSGEAADEGLRVAEAVAALAGSLDLEVTAEGVETPGQRDRLIAMGCGLAQGFHFARPMPAQDLDGFLLGWDGSR